MWMMSGISNRFGSKRLHYVFSSNMTCSKSPWVVILQQPVRKQGLLRA